MNIRNLHIGVRLGTSFGLVLILLIVTVVLGITGLGKLNTGTERLVREDWVKAKLANLALDNARGSIARVFEQVASTDSQTNAASLQRLQENTAAFDEAIAKLDPMVLSDEGKIVMNKVKEARARYVTAYGKVLTLLQSGNRDAAGKQAYGEAYAAMHAFAGALREEVDRQNARFENTSSDSAQIFESARLQMLLLGIVTLILGLGSAYAITRSITVPLTSAVRIAETVATGDLRSNIDSVYRDETGQLMLALKRMNANLTKIVGEIRSSAEIIGSATGKIANGNVTLSSRTESQAEALQETASSMEELTSTVKQNADNARQANQMAQSASEVAVKGGTVVSEVVHTMGSINDSSRKIVDIISVIDGIAFQTNILALNAAVEAARAGEQGRGFAVVATEVRNLAQRSAGAAKEIKSLIADSVEKVAAGSRLVDQAGITMNEIVDSIKRVTDIMAEIAAASQEQTAGIDQINRAIGQLDNTTQQNTALVEESATAATSLKDQSGHLTKLTSAFILEGRPLTASASTPAPRRIAAPRSAQSAGAGKLQAVPARTASDNPPPTSALKRLSSAIAAAPRRPPAASNDWEEF